MKHSDTINQATVSIKWDHTPEDVYVPTIWIDSHEVNVGDVSICKPDEDELDSYEDSFGVRPEADVFHYCDGECYHAEMNDGGGDGYSHGFQDWLAGEINSKIIELNSKNV